MYSRHCRGRCNINPPQKAMALGCSRLGLPSATLKGAYYCRDGGGGGRRDREVWWDIATALQINKSEQEKEITVLNVGFYMGFSNIPRVKGVKSFEKEALQYSEIFLLRFLLFVF